MIYILGIESSADETGASVLEGDKKTGRFRLASNVVYSQIALHRKTGGIVPEIAARSHITKILPVIQQALSKANVQISDLDAIAVTTGPGLITALRVGVDTAKALTYARAIPIIPVNHHEGHLLSAFGSQTLNSKLWQKKTFPALGLVVSGGHTLLILVEKVGKYKILGQTVDDAAGECFDKVAKLLNLPYPGGPSISKLAAKYKKPEVAADFRLPRPMLNRDDFDFSFSGLKTAVLYKIKDLKRARRFNKHSITMLAFDAQQAIVEVLVAKTVRAAKKYKVKTVLLGGGVSANAKLRESLQTAIKRDMSGVEFLRPDPLLTTDNAGMIAVVGFQKFLQKKVKKYHQPQADPNLQIQTWR